MTHLVLLVSACAAVCGAHRRCYGPVRVPHASRWRAVAALGLLGLSVVGCDPCPPGSDERLRAQIASVLGVPYDGPCVVGHDYSGDYSAAALSLAGDGGPKASASAADEACLSCLVQVCGRCVASSGMVDASCLKMCDRGNCAMPCASADGGTK